MSVVIVRRSPPRRSPPQTFTTPCVKSDVHHPRRLPTPFLKCDIHHRPTFTTPKRKIHQPPSIQNVPAFQTTLHQGSRGQSKQWLMIFETVKHGKQWKWFYKGDDECLGWWMYEVVNVWGGECLGWWIGLWNRILKSLIKVGCPSRFKSFLSDFLTGKLLLLWSF